MEMRRLQYIQTKQLKSQYLMQLLLCKRRMYNQLYFGRGKPAPLRKARVIEQMRNHNKHTDDCSTKSEWDSADFEMGCVGRGAVSDNNTKAVTV